MQRALITIDPAFFGGQFGVNIILGWRHSNWFSTSKASTPIICKAEG